MKVEIRFPISFFERLQREICSRRIVAGKGALIRSSPDGTTLEPDLSSVFVPHAWRTTPVFDFSTVGWTAIVRAGFVNANPAVIAESGLPLTDSSARLNLRAFRPIGNDESPENPIEFFQQLGVRLNKNSVRISDAGAQIVDEGEEFSQSNLLPIRRLVACDVVLAIARAALVETVTLGEATSTAQSVTYALTYDLTRLNAVGAAPRVRVETLHVPAIPPTAYERFLGLAKDAAEDTLKLATIYLLSPPGTQPEAKPDAAWTPYVGHDEFNNLAHRAANEVPPSPPAPIRFDIPIAGGVGSNIFNALLDPINEANNIARNLVAQVNPAGEFWTV